MRLRTAQMQGVYRGRPPWPPLRFDALFGLEIVTAGRPTGAPARSRSPTASASPRGSCTAASTPRWPSRSLVAATEAATGRAAAGHSNQTSFLRPITAGTVHAAGAGAAPGPHHLGVGVRRHRRRRAPVRARPDDRHAPVAPANVNGGWVGDVERPAHPCDSQPSVRLTTAQRKSLDTRPPSGI